MAEDKQNLSDIFEKLYKDLDAHAEKQVKLAKVTCRRGCDHCCYLLALITPTEAINIAEHILKSEELRVKLPELLDELRSAALAADYPNITRQSYFEKGIKCPFLVNSECSIYSHRPSPCRYHFVISDPAKCRRDAPKDVQTESLNLIPLEMEVWRLDEHVMKSPIPVAAPIPLTVLWAMKYIIDRSDMSSEDGQLLKDIVYEWCKGIKTPMEWTIAHHQSLIEDHKPFFEQVLEPEVK